MKPILNNSGTQIQLNALFIQPTRWCGLNCKGCYVKEHEGGEESYHTPYQEQYKLFEKFYDSSEAWANQITISIDDLHKDVEKHDHMASLIGFIYDSIRKDGRFKSERPEVHFTIHTRSTLKPYSEYGINTNGLLDKCDMMSISEINTPQDLEALRNAKIVAPNSHINYNHLIPGNITSFNIDKQVEKVEEIGQLVDSIYLVIMKSPIGRERNELVKVGDTSRMRHDIGYINTLMERLSPDVRRKVHVDGCLEDTRKYKRTGFGCSSNVSRVQVWPDGSVTGCPYAFNSGGPIGRTAKDILENIRQARKQYDFKDRCHLPEVYNSLQR